MFRTRFLVSMLTGALLFFPDTAATQVNSAASARSEQAEAKADLGISAMRCRCSSETKGDMTSWTFLTEPEILAVRPDGPSAGKLAAGDRVIAIDGSLITTPEGGRRWSDLRPGKDVSLRVRRDGVPRTVSIVVGSSPPEDAGSDHLDLDLDLVLPKLPRLLPEGWMGIGVSCDCSVDTSGGTPRWSFRSPPDVDGVAPDSPAEAAGLQSGDVLLRIDGHPLETAAGGRAFSEIRPGQRVRFDVRRAGQELTVELVAATREETTRPEGGR